jgi:MFS family permease
MNNCNFISGLETAWAVTIAFVPKFLAFLVLLLVGYFVAKLLGKLFEKMLDRVHFSKWVERGGVKRALEKSGYDAADILGRILFYTIFLFVLQMAFGVFGPNPISELLTRFISFLPNIFLAILIVVIAAAVAAAVREIVRASLGGLSYGKILANVGYATVLIVGIFAALDQVGIAPTIVAGLFYAILAIFAGSAIIAIGGGGIAPMREKWKQALAAAEEEAPRLKSAAAGATDRIEQRTREIQNAIETGPSKGGRRAPKD